MTAATITPRLVTALDAAWARIRELHPDVPEVVITMASGSAITRRKTAGQLLGHFAAARWQRGAVQLPELFVSGEGLGRGARDVLGTLLHEAAHGLAHARQIKDTTRQGRWHNARYRDLARELGLDVAQAPGIGWSDTTLATGTAREYAAVLRRLDAALVAFRHAEFRGRGRASSNNLLVAQCACPRKIRASATVLAAGPITCSRCGDDFTAS